MPDKEEAAYYFNDLQQFLPDRVYFFPSSFKKGFSSGAKDNQGLLARTEVLNLLNGRLRKFIIVSYPEAVTEKVVNKKYLEKNTLKLMVGERVNMDFILDLLLEEKVLLVQGSGFNWKTPDHFRVVFLPNVDDLKEAITRIARFLDQYRKQQGTK